MKIIDCEQCSPEWFKVRAGIPTSSEFSKIICCDGKPSKQREKYMWRLVGERLGGIVEESFQSFAMMRGKEKEDEAKKFYTFTREPIQSVGFCLSDCGRFGASTDGLIGDKGVFELKCPEMATHVGYLLAEPKIPTEYYQQTQGELFVTGREYVEFLSYYPGLKPFLVRERPDDVFQKALKRELELFCEELEELTNKLK
jgi:putative phage-type endonuclease